VAELSALKTSIEAHFKKIKESRRPKQHVNSGVTKHNPFFKFDQRSRSALQEFKEGDCQPRAFEGSVLCQDYQRLLLCEPAFAFELLLETVPTKFNRFHRAERRAQLSCQLIGHEDFESYEMVIEVLDYHGTAVLEFSSPNSLVHVLPHYIETKEVLL
jgi:hypothetical protein